MNEILLTVIMIFILFFLCKAMTYYIASELAKDIISYCSNQFITKRKISKEKAIKGLLNDNTKMAKLTLKLLLKDEKFKSI